MDWLERMRNDPDGVRREHGNAVCRPTPKLVAIGQAMLQLRADGWALLVSVPVAAGAVCVRHLPLPPTHVATLVLLPPTGRLEARRDRLAWRQLGRGGYLVRIAGEWDDRSHGDRQEKKDDRSECVFAASE